MVGLARIEKPSTVKQANIEITCPECDYHDESQDALYVQHEEGPSGPRADVIFMCFACKQQYVIHSQ